MQSQRSAYNTEVDTFGKHSGMEPVDESDCGQAVIRTSTSVVAALMQAAGETSVSVGIV